MTPDQRWYGEDGEPRWLPDLDGPPDPPEWAPVVALASRQNPAEPPQTARTAPIDVEVPLVTRADRIRRFMEAIR